MSTESTSNLIDIKFKKDSLIDNILVELINAHYELRTINESVSNETIETDGKRQREYKFRTKIRRQYVREKVNFLSGLLTM